MNKNQIVEYLCVYDKRNPMYDDMFGDDEDKIQWKAKEGCTCDNCFYGRHELANELLKYIVGEKYKLTI